MTEAVRKGTDIAFITITAPDRTRFTHTNPAMIGGKYIGNIIGLVAAGITETEPGRTLALAVAAHRGDRPWRPGTFVCRYLGDPAPHPAPDPRPAPDEPRVMYDHHDAILHSVSEGLIVLDRDGVALVNDEARRLLSLPPGPISHQDLPEYLDW